jgi:Zn-dependent peptidase ImmA (M78 family)
MTLGVQNFCGRRLTEARLARGFFKKSLADMVGISGMAIGRYEDGLDNPQHDKLRLLADQLKFPIEFFLQPGWPEELELVFWRQRSSETKYAREMTEQRMRWLCEIFSFLEREVDFPAVNLPTLDLPNDFRLISAEMIEDATMQVRKHWGLRDLPIPDVTLALENAGVPVVNLEIASEKQDGFCFRSRELDRSFVGINIHNVSAARARFDAAHELGHIVLHKHVTPQESRDPVFHKILEQQAHRFAGAFLFPQRAFLAEVGAPTLYYFSDLKRRWGMSIAAMIFRAFDLGIVDDNEKSALYHNMARRRWRGVLREPFDSHQDMPLEKPRMLKRGLEVVVGSGIFGRSTIKSSLALPQTEIERITGTDAGFLNEADIISLALPKRGPSFKTLDLETGNILEFPERPHKPSLR